MGLKDAAMLYKVNEYLKKPEIKKMLVDKIVDASKDPEFKEFLKEDVEQVLQERRLPTAKSPQAKTVIQKTVTDKDAIKRTVKEVLKELENDTGFKKEHRPLGSRFIETILQTKILDFRFKDLYLKQRSFAWISSVTAVCFILAFITKLNNNIPMSKVFLAVGTGLVVGGFITYFFFARTYKDIFAK